jgi:Carboxypeptidase regulatory-like domain
MQRSELLLRALSCVVLVAALGTACSPAAPSSEFTSIGCGEQLDGYQCHAEYGTAAQARDVTGLATWSASDANIATVNSVGFVTVLRAGSVAIRAKYRDAETFLTMDVAPGGLRRYYRAVSGFVTNSQDRSKIAGVMVTILDGANASRRTTTGIDGAYQFYDLEVGTFTVRFSRNGYTTLDQPFVLTGDKFNDLSVTLVKSP